MWLGSAEQDKITAKRYLYILRSLLAARYISENRAPAPVELTGTLDSLDLEVTVMEAVKEMILAKTHQRETDKVARVTVLDQFIENERIRLEGVVDHLPSEQGSVDRLDGFFRNAIGFDEKVLRKN